jgi:lipoprotein-anchoring transpeptidase ErfK/SrfK
MFATLFTRQAMSSRCLFVAIVLLLASGGGAAARELSLETINAAEWPAKKADGLEPTIVKAEVLLDRARFSPGVIDGVASDNFRKALSAFQKARQLKADGRLDAATWTKLSEGAGTPVMVQYTLKDADVSGPFTPNIPAKLEDMAKLKRLDYTGPIQLIAEKFHMDEWLLKALNPGRSFSQAGESILVADASRAPGKRPAAKIEVDKRSKSVRAIGKDGELIASYPASIGSQEKPAPTGSFKVRSIEKDPEYRYDPKFHFEGVKTQKPFTVGPGPNNPVGSIWIGLSLPTYGIHGTPEPAKVSKAYSHGCVRLTNWDVRDLASLVAKGAPVEFLD